MEILFFKNMKNDAFNLESIHDSGIKNQKDVNIVFF